MTYSVGSLFAGIGGICIGFKQAGCSLKWANEIDHNACETYRNNISEFEEGFKLIESDVCDFTPDVKVDILTGGFPCQPYSIAGKRQGLNDDRGQPMFEQILRIADECQPRVLFLENVSTLKNFDKGRTFPLLMSLLEEHGYPYHVDFIYNSCEYSGIAQNRDRIYIVVFRDKHDYFSFNYSMGEGLDKIPVTENLSTIVNLKDMKPKKYYYSKDEPGTCRSIRYYEHFVPNITEQGVVYQYRRKYVRSNKNGNCPALTACMGCGGHNVPLILDDYGIRKLTPEECLRFQGFPRGFSFPKNMTDTHKYKQIGNAVTVPVVRRIAEKIVESMRYVDLN